MFVENYRLDPMIGGQAPPVIPYPKISDEDWQTWKAFLPVKAVPFCKKVLLHREKTFLHNAYDIPPEICLRCSKEPVISKRLRFGVSARFAKTPLPWASAQMASAI
jgi:hypothetical protein